MEVLPRSWQLAAVATHVSTVAAHQVLGRQHRRGRTRGDGDPVAEHLGGGEGPAAATLLLVPNRVDEPGPVCASIKAYNKLDSFDYPIIADPNRTIANTYGMMDPDELDSKGMPLTCRAVFIIGPDKKLKLSILYPATTGRNFDEVLRVIDSLQLTAVKKVATPADWRNGGSCMVVPSVKPEEVAGLFPQGVTIHDVPSGKQYLRTTPQPN